jgi:hypothetical protein
LLTVHQAAAWVYVLAAPAAAHWQAFAELQVAVAGLPCVLVTTTLPLVSTLAQGTAGVELVEAPFDIDDLVAAVQRALAQQFHPV